MGPSKPTPVPDSTSPARSRYTASEMNALFETFTDLLSLFAENWGKLAIASIIAVPVFCFLSNVAQAVN